MARGPSILPEDWLRSPEDRKRRRVITVDLEGERFDPIFQYANAVAPDRSVQESIRDLLLQSISDDPMAVAIREAKRMAYKEARERVLADVSKYLRQLAVELDLEPQSRETQGLPAAENQILDREPKSIFE